MKLSNKDLNAIIILTKMRNGNDMLLPPPSIELRPSLPKAIIKTKKKRKLSEIIDDYVKTKITILNEHPDLLQRNNKLKGVSYHKSIKKYETKMRYKGTTFYGGYYKQKLLGCLVYDALVVNFNKDKKLHKKKLNFPFLI